MASAICGCGRPVVEYEHGRGSDGSCWPSDNDVFRCPVCNAFATRGVVIASRGGPIMHCPPAPAWWPNVPKTKEL